jgi:hypothetical protein
LRSTKSKAPWTLLLAAFGSQNYPPATHYTYWFVSFLLSPSLAPPLPRARTTGRRQRSSRAHAQARPAAGAGFFLPTVTTIYTAVTALTVAARYKKTAVKSIKPNLSNRCQWFTAWFVRYTAQFLFLVPTARTTVKKTLGGRSTTRTHGRQRGDPTRRRNQRGEAPTRTRGLRRRSSHARPAGGRRALMCAGPAAEELPRARGRRRWRSLARATGNGADLARGGRIKCVHDMCVPLGTERTFPKATSVQPKRGGRIKCVHDMCIPLGSERTFPKATSVQPKRPFSIPHQFC